MNKRYTYLLLFALLIASCSVFATPITYNGHYTLLNKHDFGYVKVKNEAEFDFSSFEYAKNKINFGQSDEIVYLRFAITNKGKENQLAISIDNPMTDTVSLYRLHQGNFESLGRYSYDNIRQRKIKFATPIFPFILDSGETDTFFVRVHSSEELIIPVMIGSESETIDTQSFKGNIYWLFGGIIFVIFFYNLFLYFSTKDKLYAYYIIYIFSIGMAQLSLSGMLLSDFLFNYPLLYKLSIVVFPSLSGVFAVIFLRQFIYTKKHVPKLDTVILIVLVGYLLAGVFRIFRFDHISASMLDVIALPGTVSVYSAAITIARKKERTARFFLLAWTFFIVGILLFVLRNLDVLPFNEFTTYGMPVGAALEAILLSFALADKINLLEKERRKQEYERILALEENKRLIQQQNETLEISVKERTKELSMALRQLKDTQAQLVENEKLSSLGQLTAGIAHEINNPINFVNANINPLKRDIYILKELIDRFEEIALNTELNIEEKKNRFQALKDENEFAYLNQEIDFLIKGIGDGASRTIEIVKGLRVFSRVEEDSLKISNIVDGINSTLIILNNQLGEIEIDKQIRCTPMMECYPGKLNQVFLNLLTNSIYAIRKRIGQTKGGKIAIHVFDEDEIRHFIFRDNGCGIESENTTRIFDPFYTDKPPGEGTGLGLAISYRIIEMHNGKISFTSQVGQGTEFIIKIPINQFNA